MLSSIFGVLAMAARLLLGHLVRLHSHGAQAVGSAWHIQCFTTFGAMHLCYASACLILEHSASGTTVVLTSSLPRFSYITLLGRPYLGIPHILTQRLVL